MIFFIFVGNIENLKFLGVFLGCKVRQNKTKFLNSQIKMKEVNNKARQSKTKFLSSQIQM